MAIFVVYSCEKGDQTAIIKVDDEVITLASFKNQYQKHLTSVLQEDNLLSRYSFLNKLIDEKLILRYAVLNELENDSLYIKTVKDIYQQMLLNYYFDQKINKNFTVTDLEARKFFTWQNKRIHVRHLFSRSQQKIMALQERLLSGNENWSTLALECFQDSILRSSGGNIGWYDFNDLDPVFAYHAYSLNLGEISDPVRTSDGYSIIQLINIETNGLLTENAFQLKKEKLTDAVKYFKQKQSLVNVTDSTSISLNINFNKNIVEQLHSSIISTGSNQIESLYKETLVSYRNGSWSVLKSLQKLSSLSERQLSKIITPLDLEQSIIGLICREKFLNDAKKKKIFQNISFDENFSAERDKVMIKHVLDKLNKNKIGNGIGIFEEKYSFFRDELMSNTIVMIDSATVKRFTL
tara:strand:+ start:5361 stop:6584 length:1224 start_codon:yes stop_codon:yes gene_type:complete